MNEDRRRKVREDLEDVHDEVVRQLQRCRTGEPTSGTPTQLQMIERELRKMISALDSEQLPPRGSRTAGLWHIVTDSWPVRDPLGEKIVAVELAFDRL